MPKIPQRIPAALSGRGSALSAAIFAAGGKEVDVAIGGIPFLLATYSELPQTVETAPRQKDQFDAEQEPGEQSLSGWWRRSQSSWHDGAGNLYQESRLNNDPSNGYFDSEGIDIFTQGEMKLLRRMEEHDTGNNLERLRVYTDSGVEKISVTAGTAGLKSIDDYDGSLSVIHAPGGKTIADGFIANTTYYNLATDGTLYEGTVGGGGPTSWRPQRCTCRSIPGSGA